MKKLAATLAAVLALPVLLFSSDANAYERTQTRVSIEAAIHRPTPRPTPQMQPRHRPSRTGQWKWQQVVTQAPDRIERVAVEICKPRGKSHKPPKCHTTYENRVGPGARTTAWQWVWGDQHDRRVVRAW